MKILSAKLYQRVTNLSFAFVLALSSFAAAAAPFFVSDSTSALESTVAYSNVPSTLASNYPSFGYEATQLSELGYEVDLGAANTKLDTATVTMSSWACQTGNWYSNDCYSAPGSSYVHPVTVNFYAVDAAHNVGSLITSSTQNITVPFRPSATSITEGRYQAADNLFYNGLAFNAQFNLSSLHQTLPQKFVMTVAYNTAHYGVNPLGVGGPYDSLNVAVPASTVTAGAQGNPGIAFERIASGSLTAEDYTNQFPLFKITTTPANTAPVVTFNAPTPANGYVHGTINGNVTFTDDYGMTGYAVRFWKNAYEVAGGGTLVKDCSSYPGGYLLGTTQNVSCSLDVSGDANGTKYFFSAQVLDGDNTWSSDIRSYTVDNTAPTLYVKQGANLVAPSSTTGVFKTVDFKLYDNTLVDKVTINGVIKDVSNAQWSDVNGVTAGQLGAVEGSNTIVLYDVAGNTTSYTFTIDTTAPIGTLSYSPSTLTNQSVVATLETNEPIQLAALTGTWNQVTPQKFTKVFPINAVQAQSLKDAVGNTGTITVNINWIDKSAPAAPVITNSPITINSSMANAQATWSHNEVDVDHYEYREYLNAAAANADADGNTASYWVVNHPANEKTQTVGQSWTGEQTLYYRVVAVDAAGNRSAPSALGTITIDKVAPAAPVFAVKVGSTTLASGSSTNSYLFDQVWNVPTGNPVSYQYRYWNAIAGNQYKVGSEYIVNTTNTNIPAEFNQGEGTHYMQVRAFDAVGNASDWSTLYTIIYDETAPTASVSYSPAAATKNDVTVTLTANEALDASTLPGWTKVSDTVYTNEYAENTTVTVTYKDLAGNSGSSVVSINWIDKTAPSVTIDVPTVTLVTDATPTITGTYDNNQELATDDTTIVLFIDGSEEGVAVTKNADGTWSYTPAVALSEGQHTFVAVANDAVGNVSEASNVLTLTIDTLAPNVNVLFADKNANNSVTFRGNADLDAVSLTVSFNGQVVDVTNNAGEWTYTSGVLTPGQSYDFSITARDEAGNGTIAANTVAIAPTPAATFSVTPTTVGPAAVLGATTDNDQAAQNGSADVAGATDDKTADAAKSDANNGTIFGLAWYWWILILAALAAIAWFIIGAVRNRNNSEA